MRHFDQFQSASVFIRELLPYVQMIGSLGALGGVLLRLWARIPSRDTTALAISNKPRLTDTLTHSFDHEIIVALPFALLLNIGGAELARALASNGVFFDMLGTAVVAYVLGPWWAGITGLTTNTFEALLHGHPTDLSYGVVNAVGGIWWGYLFRLPDVSEPLFGSKWSREQFLKSTFLLGVIGGLICSLLVALVDYCTNVTAAGSHMVIVHFALIALQNIPDKLVSVIFASLMIRALFPLFVTMNVNTVRGGGRMPVLIFLVCFVAYSLVAFFATGLLDDSRVAAPSILASTYAAVFATALLAGIKQWQDADRMDSDATAKQDREAVYERLDAIRSHGEQRLDSAALMTMLIVVVVVLGIQAAGANPGAAVAMADGLTPAVAAPPPLFHIDPAFIWRFVVLVVVFYVLAKVFDVAARQNRVAQLLKDKQRVAEANAA